MAKKVETKSTGKQTTLNGFFKGMKLEPANSEEPVVSDNDMDVDNDAEVDATVGKKDNKIAPDDSSFPPISDIPAIFADIVKRIPDIAEVAKRIEGRKLRIATMCSGTESPLLAFGLIQKAVQEQYKVDLEMEHVFSCEIVPFKQAYIERNFSPPLLFRDVCELGNDYACAPPFYYTVLLKSLIRTIVIPHTVPSHLFPETSTFLLQAHPA